MNDRRAHFLTLAGDTCTGAGMASIEVEFMLADGSSRIGVPSTLPREALPGEEDMALDQTGYANELLVDGSPIELDSVVAFTIRTP